MYSTYVGQWVKPDTCHYWLLWSTEESTFLSLGNMSHQCHLWRGREGGERGRGEREGREGEERGREEREGREGGERGRGEREGREGEERGRGERERRGGATQVSSHLVEILELCFPVCQWHSQFVGKPEWGGEGSEGEEEREEEGRGGYIRERR